MSTIKCFEACIALGGKVHELGDAGTEILQSSGLRYSSNFNRCADDFLAADVRVKRIAARRRPARF
jgi:hypothetical protein